MRKFGLGLRSDDSVVMSTSYLQFTGTVERFSQHNNYPLTVLLCSDPGVEQLWGGLLDQRSGPASFIELHIIYPYNEGDSTYGNTQHTELATVIISHKKNVRATIKTSLMSYVTCSSDKVKTKRRRIIWIFQFSI